MYSSNFIQQDKDNHINKDFMTIKAIENAISKVRTLIDLDKYRMVASFSVECFCFLFFRKECLTGQQQSYKAAVIVNINLCNP